MNKIMVRISIILTVILVVCTASAAATSLEKEEQYQATILQLESWLETPGRSSAELEQIAASFDALQGYKMSKGFFYYTNVIIKAIEGNYDNNFKFWINMLEKNDGFQAYIKNDINSLSILSVPEMINYAKGREAESEGNIAVAIKCYADSINFYDASNRYESLALNEYATKYDKARRMVEKNDLVSAYSLFAEIEGYDDSSQYMEYIIQELGYNPAQETPKPIETPTPTPTPRLQEFVSSIVSFGHYEQDNNTANGREAIEWIVLDYDEANHKALLISKYGLDAIPYNEKQTAITWGKCTLRSWLNGAFLKRAFSAEEQSAILITNVDNGPSQGYSKWYTNSGNNTQDQIFLLSCSEANHYLDLPFDDSNNKQSRVAPTAYAIAQGAYLSNSNQTADGEPAGRWWLRSPGDSQNSAADASSDGSLSRSDVSRDSVVVRPALWVDLAAFQNDLIQKNGP